MRQGNDSAIKSYLASRLSLYMSRCAAMSHELKNATTSLSTQNNESENLKKALDEIRSHKDVNEESLRSAHTNEIAGKAILSSMLYTFLSININMIQNQ